MPATIDRIGPAEARRDLQSGAMLVCAYDDMAKFRQNHLAGAISYEQFQHDLGSLPKDQEIIFYCG